MSTLLIQPVVVEALDILGIKNPKAHESYLSLLSIYSGVEDFIPCPEGEPDPNGVWVDSVSCHGKYTASDGTARRVNFVIMGKNDISQLFMYLIFMEYKVIPHISRISINNETSTKIIAIASDYVHRNRPHI